jgi:hypothetical protein
MLLGELAIELGTARVGLDEPSTGYLARHALGHPLGREEVVSLVHGRPRLSPEDRARLARALDTYRGE